MVYLNITIAHSLTQPNIEVLYLILKYGCANKYVAIHITN